MNDYYKTCPFPKPVDRKKKKKQTAIKTSPKESVIIAGHMELNATKYTEAPIARSA